MHTVSVQLFLSCRVSCVKNINMRHMSSSSDAIYTTEDMLQIIVATHVLVIFMGPKKVKLLAFIAAFLANDILNFKIVLYVSAKATTCQSIHSTHPVIKSLSLSECICVIHVFWCFVFGVWGWGGGSSPGVDFLML